MPTALRERGGNKKHIQYLYTRNIHQKKAEGKRGQEATY